MRFKTGLHLGRLCTEEIHIWGSREWGSPIIEHVLETRVPSVFALHQSEFGKETVRELPGEWHNDCRG